MLQPLVESLLCLDLDRRRWDGLGRKDHHGSSEQLRKNANAQSVNRRDVLGVDYTIDFRLRLMHVPRRSSHNRHLATAWPTYSSHGPLLPHNHKGGGPLDANLFSLPRVRDAVFPAWWIRNPPDTPTPCDLRLPLSPGGLQQLGRYQCCVREGA
jgi:hypothetical protein